MSKLQEYLKEKDELKVRYDAVDSILIEMNVGVNPSVCTQSTVRFIGMTKEYHHKLTPIQSKLLREFLYKEKETIRIRLDEIESALEKAESVL